MKQRDIIVIVAVAVASGVLSFVLARVLFGGEKTYNLSAPSVEPISAEFVTPDSKYFNKNSIDPTKYIEIGDNNNQTPFKPN